MRPSLPISTRIKLEVERKFVCTPHTKNLLHANSGSPPLPNLAFKGQHSFEDTYYDFDKALFSHGIWIRKRNGTWQAKIRQGGDFTNSQFSELEGKKDIKALVERLHVGADTGTVNFGLGEMARYVTQRDVWKVADAYEIVVDSTNFGHLVGEVELQQAIEPGEEAEKDAAIRMAAQIKDFMLKHAWAFPSGKVIGKLSAYFEWARAKKANLAET